MGALVTRAECMCELVWSFPTLRRTPATTMVTAGDWDSIAFANYWATGSGGEKDAALFVLSVWNPASDWEECCGLSRGGENGGRFNLHTALGNWDDGHRSAFIAWARAPWWP